MSHCIRTPRSMATEAPNYWYLSSPYLFTPSNNFHPGRAPLIVEKSRGGRYYSMAVQTTTSSAVVRNTMGIRMWSLNTFPPKTIISSRSEGLGVEIRNGVYHEHSLESGQHFPSRYSKSRCPVASPLCSLGIHNLGRFPGRNIIHVSLKA
jgi:hypothetical protein